MTPLLWIILSWVLFAPLGYVACRWSNRTTGDSWTRMDRLYAIIGAIFYGPMMPVLAVLVALLWRLHMSDWARKDARW